MENLSRWAMGGKIVDFHEQMIPREGGVLGAYTERIRWCLEGGPILGELALKYVDLMQGSILVFIPQEFGAGDIFDPWQGLPARPDAQIEKGAKYARHLHGLPRFIQREMNAHSYCGLVVDYLSIPTDPLVDGWGGRSHLGPLNVWYCGQNVYYTFFPPQHVDYIEALLNFAESPSPFYGILSSCNLRGESTVQRRAKEMSIEELDVFAKTVQVLFVSAFDGEGYVAWIRREAT